MTQDVYFGRRAGNAGNLPALEAWNPDRASDAKDEPGETK